PPDRGAALAGLGRDDRPAHDRRLPRAAPAGPDPGGDPEADVASEARRARAGAVGLGAVVGPGPVGRAQERAWELRAPGHQRLGGRPDAAGAAQAEPLADRDHLPP